MSSGTNSQRIIENNTLINNNNLDLDAIKTAINNLPSSASTTATAGDIISGKTAISQGQLITGTHVLPSGIINITENGTVNVTDYASANVNVPQLDTSDADAVAINIRESKTAYVNGQKITGTLPVLTYPSGDFDSQFIAGDSAYTKNRDNTDFLVGTFQIAPNNKPDSWMFEGNRKMKLGIPYNLVAQKLGVTSNKIKQGEAIAGVSGNVVPVNNESTRTVNPSTLSQDITPASGYTGLSKVTVNGVTSSIDNNIQAENIKDGVTILGITGTYTPATPPSGTINIITNGIHDVTNYETANVDIPVGYTHDCTEIGYPQEAIPQDIINSWNKMFTYSKEIYDNWNPTNEYPTGYFYTNYRLMFLPLIDTSNCIRLSNFCSCCYSLLYIPLLNTSNVTHMQNTFGGCVNLLNVPLFDTSKVKFFTNTFEGCTVLKNIPRFNGTSMTMVDDAFKNCPNLTDESLNNIMAMCTDINLSNFSTYGSYGASLRTLGLSQTQATTCQGLSNYQAFLNAGWITGY